MQCPGCRNSMSVTANVHWCGVCGTMMAFGTVHIPAVVQRCRDYFAGSVQGNKTVEAVWSREGLSELLERK